MGFYLEFGLALFSRLTYTVYFLNQLGPKPVIFNFAGDNIHNLSINHSRSSSVPPMSTFRRPAVMVQKMSDVGTFQNSPSVVSLPGLQTTYQPGTTYKSISGLCENS